MDRDKAVISKPIPAKKDEQKTITTQVISVLPWVAGIGFAATQIASSSRCTAVNQGHCSQCGSCAIALAGLVTWALSKNKNRDDFFISK